MKKFIYLIVLALILGLVLTGCTLLSNIGQTPTSEQSGISYLTKGTEAVPDEFPLYAGQTIPVGTVYVWDDGSNLTITYDTTDSGWVMTETHLAVAPVQFDDDRNILVPSSEDISQTKKGNPIPGQFPYKHENLGSVAIDTYTILLSEIEEDRVEAYDILYIAAHAEVHKEYEEEFGPDIVVNGGFEFPVVTRMVNDNYWDFYSSGDEGLGWIVEWYGNSNDLSRPSTANLELHRNVKGWSDECGEQYAELDTGWEANDAIVHGGSASVRIYQDLEINPYSHSTLSYAWSPRPGYLDNKLEVYWNGFLLKTHSDSGIGEINTSWNLETLTNLTPSPTGITRLEFIEVGTPDALGMFLDCVSVICTMVQEESAWAGTVEGEMQFPGKNWATYFTYDVQGILTGTWLLNVNDGAHMHDMLIESQDLSGVLTGTGGWKAGSLPYATTWNLTGETDGNSVEFIIIYQGPYNPGYTTTLTGTINSDWNSMSGTGTSGVSTWIATRIL